MHHPTKERGHPQLRRDERSLSRCKFWDSEDEKWGKEEFLNPVALIQSSDFVSQVQRLLSGFVRLFSLLLTISPLLFNISKIIVIRIYLFSYIADFGKWLTSSWHNTAIYNIVNTHLSSRKNLAVGTARFFHKRHQRLILNKPIRLSKNVRKNEFFLRNFCVSVFSSERWQAKITWPWREKLQSIDDTCQLDI